MTLDDHGINPGVWLGDNPLCLDSAEFRNQNTSFRILYQEYNPIIESEGLAFVYYHMVCVPTALYVYNLI